MDTFWLKVIALIIVIAGVFIGYTLLKPAENNEPKEPPKTIYDMAREDKKNLLAEPNATDFEKEPQTQTAPVTLYFKEVAEIESIDAENTLAKIPSFRSIGRAPMMGYKPMVESCRLLMQRYPGTIYDYKARRALAQIPKQYRQRYGITDGQIDLDYFKTPRPNTIPYTVTEDD